MSILPGSIKYGLHNLELLIEEQCRVSSSCEILIVTDKDIYEIGIVQKIIRVLDSNDVVVNVFNNIKPNPSIIHLQQCCEELNKSDYDFIIAVGGGSVIDVAKASSSLYMVDNIREYMGLKNVTNKGIPVIVIPTIFGSGAESSSHSVIYDPRNDKKEVFSGESLIPTSVVIEPELTTSIKQKQLVYSVLDGIVHAIESTTSNNSTIITQTLAKSAIERIINSLLKIVNKEESSDAIWDLTLGCFLSGVCMANTNAGPIHALGYPLQNLYDIPHGLSNAMMAPATFNYIESQHPNIYNKVKEIFLNELGLGQDYYSMGQVFEVLLYKINEKVELDNYNISKEDLDYLSNEAAKFKPVLNNTPCSFYKDDLFYLYNTAL